MADENVLAYAPTSAAPFEQQSTIVLSDRRIPTEAIPDDGRVLMRVHKQYLDKVGRLRPVAFRDQGDGMSTDWEKYSTPLETKNRAKIPSDNGVISLVVGSIRENRRLTVVHTPHNADPPHERHVDVFGEKDPETRMHLLGIAQWEIHYKAAI